MTQRHPAGARKYDDVRDGPIILTEAEEQEFRRRASALSKILTDDKMKAKYKLEILFAKARSAHEPVPGAISFWESGSKLHGGGDEKLYLCPGKALGRNDCEALVPDSHNSARGAVCSACGCIWKQEQLIGEVMLRIPMAKWAEVTLHYYGVCEHNCDVYVKHSPLDHRAVARAQAAKQTWGGTKALDRARASRVRYIYPLRNIIKDTSAGASLLSRFRAFLTA